MSTPKILVETAGPVTTITIFLLARFANRNFFVMLFQQGLACAFNPALEQLHKGAAL